MSTFFVFLVLLTIIAVYIALRMAYNVPIIPSILKPKPKQQRGTIKQMVDEYRVKKNLNIVYTPNNFDNNSAKKVAANKNLNPPIVQLQTNEDKNLEDLTSNESSLEQIKVADIESNKPIEGAEKWSRENFRREAISLEDPEYCTTKNEIKEVEPIKQVAKKKRVFSSFDMIYYDIILKKKY